MLPILLPHTGPPAFPDPREFDDQGLVAVGGDLSPARLLAAYRRGIFPWYNEATPPLWWSPNPRAILPLDRLHASRSMRALLRKRNFKSTWNHAFLDVVLACGDRQEGTWILPEMVEAYLALHRMQRAFSIEIWMDGELAGGLYGVQSGALFAAESMFHRRTNASKIALLLCASSLRDAGIELFDVQFLTPHLASLGVVEIPRSEYLSRLEQAQKRQPCLIRLDLATSV